MPRDERTFITVHDGMPEHPKVEGLSDAAFRLMVEIWCWCSRNRTDGKVTTASWRKRGTPRARKELVTAGLVDEHEDGVVVHDYLEHQRSAAEIDELSAKRRAAGSKGGKAKASATALARPVAKQTASKSVAESETDTEKNNSSTSKGERNAPAGFAARIIRAYVDSARTAGVAAPEESQARVERSARSLYAQGYPEADIESAARNAAVGGWCDLAVQLQRDTARASPPDGTKPSTTDDRAAAALAAGKAAAALQLTPSFDRKAI